MEDGGDLHESQSALKVLQSIRPEMSQLSQLSLDQLLEFLGHGAGLELLVLAKGVLASRLAKRCERDGFGRRGGGGGAQVHVRPKTEK